MIFVNKYVKKSEIPEIAKKIGRSKEEIMDTIQELINKGLVKSVGNKYDFSLFLKLQERFSEELRKHGNVNVKKMYGEVTRK
ncbi:hypothetical protein P4489_06645 [Heyndrickxia sporothermodurans]|uniref:hypothetical protein n=1 Tax=Heyndrickxia sporothermodurans TaxID=46224 RepID=UPI002E23C670|nr:hypothetical protein [Heyndrickxia sporothermodurans]